MFYRLINHAGCWNTHSRRIRKSWAAGEWFTNSSWIYCYFGPPFAPVFLWFVRNMHDFRLDSSCLFYLRKFRLVVHAKCWQGAFVWTMKLNLQKLKKRYESSLKSHIPESMLQLWACHFQVFKNSLKNCILSKSKNFFTEAHWGK